MINSKKVLFVITRLDLGGAQKHVFDLASGLADKYTCFVFSGVEGELVNDFQSECSIRFHGSRFLVHPICPLFDLIVLIELIFFIKKHKINVVHTHSSKAGIIGRCAAFFAGVPAIVHTVHGWSFNDYQAKLIKNFYIFLEKLVGRITKCFIVVSSRDARTGIENEIGLASQYRLIRYGLSLKDFEKDCACDFRKGLNIPQDVPIIGTIMCLKPQKCPQDLISVAFTVKELLPKARFIVVGDGPLRAEVRSEVCKANLNDTVILLGWRRDVIEILKCLDVFLLVSRWEGLPIAMLEAMAAKVPVVVSDTGGTAEVIKDGYNGFVSRVGDVPRFSKCIYDLVKNKELHSKISQAAYQTIVASDFDKTSMIRSIDQVYQDVLGVWRD